ncbi:hypothetical protein WICMUC_003702 [Wickerhamomyces mucosus]|uniref:Secreted protein n=1 Tax=Wickerhamomyces mucosus TaxID=1378264 RepID=A0A9P8PK67_9ASCO|nr:hypothetical protein WICMUC_003702 [Wickerhamomyces mucosus]
MQFSKTLAYSLSFLVTSISATSIQLWAGGDNFPANEEQRGLSSIHEGAGFNYFFLGTNAQTFEYSESEGKIYQPISEQYNYTVGHFTESEFPFLVSGVAGTPLSFKIEDGVLLNENGYNFYIAKNVSDPYNYGQNAYTVGIAANDSSFVNKYEDVREITVFAYKV